MSITRPTGSYARQMLDPGGWVEADEDTFYDRAQEYSQVLQRVTDVLDTCRQQKGHVFEGGLWSGGAANAANGALGANINQLMTLQDYLATVITWHRHIAGLIEQAKSDIGNNVDGAQREIDILENDPSLDADERHTAINSLVTATHGANVSLVAETAERVLESKNWKPPKNALEDLLQQKSPPPPDVPTLVVPSPGTPGTPGNPDHAGNPNHTHPGSAGNSDHTNARHSRHAGDPGQAGHPGDPGQTGHTRRANPDHAGHPPGRPGHTGNPGHARYPSSRSTPAAGSGTGAIAWAPAGYTGHSRSVWSSNTGHPRGRAGAARQTRGVGGATWCAGPACGRGDAVGACPCGRIRRVGDAGCGVRCPGRTGGGRRAERYRRGSGRAFERGYGRGLGRGVACCHWAGAGGYLGQGGGTEHAGGLGADGTSCPPAVDRSHRQTRSQRVCR